jgi:transmembrane sensor
MESQHKSMSTNDYEQLCVKAVTDRLTSSEKKELNDWLNRSEENRVYYENCKRTWQQTGLSAPPEIPDAQTEWHDLARVLSISPNKKKTGLLPSITHRLRSLWSVSSARSRWVFASAAVVLLLVFSLIQFVFNANSIQTVMTQPAEKTMVRLPDGSEVWLNSESTLQYTKKFSAKERKVQLTGEAYFTVVKDKKPFVVCTENARTQVLGTAFNVWARHQETRVIVKRGHVRLMRSLQDSDSVDLIKNQMSRIEQQDPPENPSSVNAENRIGWMEGRLLFEKAPLSEILEEVERFYGVKIDLMNDTLSRETLTATFENIPLSTVLQSLSLSYNTAYRVRSDGQIDFGIPQEETL